MEHVTRAPGRRARRAAAWIALAGGLLGAPAIGAAQTLHTLHGTVMDATGGVLVGADVEIAGGGQSHQMKTDATGQYERAALPPGDYVITVRYPGFQPATVRRRIAGDPTAVVDVVLRVLVTAEVYVAPSDVPGEGAAASLFTRVLSGQDLDELPSGISALQRRLQELAGATGRPGDVVIYVDGFRRTVRLPPREAIQTIRISSNPFAAEFAEPGHSRVEILTKPGFSRYAGQLTYKYNDGALNATHPFAPERANVQARSVHGYLGGPVIPNKWSVVAYGGRWQEDRSDVINATVLGPETPEASSGQSFARGIVTPRTIDNGWIGSTHQVGTSHVVAVSFSHTRDEARNQGLDGGLDLPERAYSQGVRESLARVAVTSALGPRLINELRVEGRRRDSSASAETDAAAVTVLDAFTSGGNQADAPRLSVADSVQIGSQLTFAAGRSTFKAGLDADLLRQRDTNRAGFGGTFVFGSDVERDAGGRPIPAGEPGAGLVDPLEAYRRTLLGVPGYAPSQFWIVEGDPHVAFSQWWAAWFAQGDWTPSSRFTLSYGVRHEAQSRVYRARTIGPRVGVAWSPGQSGRNTIRAGAGVFFDRIPPAIVLDSARLDGTRQRRFTVSSPSFFPEVPVDWLSEAVMRAPTVYTLDPGLDTPRSLVVSLGFDRRLTANLHASLAYAHQRGRSLLRARNVNAPVDGVRPFPDRGPVFQYESSGRSERHELLLALRTNWTKALTAFVNYTLASTRSDTDGPTTRPADSYDLSGEFARSGTDARHHSTAGVTLRMPGQLIVSAYAVMRSGRPFNITTGRDLNGDTVFADRPAFADPADPNAIETPFGWLNPRPQPGDALIPRNFGREPADMRMDLHVQKSFRTGLGRTQFRIGADVVNVLNRPNRAQFNGVLISPAFGSPRRALDPRTVELFSALSF